MRAFCVAVAVGAVGVVAVLFSPPAGAKGKPPKADKRIKMNVVFNQDFPGASVTGDGVYTHDPAKDVDVFLFGSDGGNLGMRLEGSTRRVHLDVPDAGVDGSMAEVHELNNNGLQMDFACEESGLRGLLCIGIEGMPNPVASGFKVDWDDPGSNWRFRVSWRDDQYIDTTGVDGARANEVRITRCGLQNPVPEECAETRLSGLGVPTDVVDPTHIWVFSTREGTLPGCFPTEDCTTGPLARVSASTIKGKPKTQEFGIFEMPFEMVAWCKEDTAGNCTS